VLSYAICGIQKFRSKSTVNLRNFKGMLKVILKQGGRLPVLRDKKILGIYLRIQKERCDSRMNLRGGSTTLSGI